MKYVVIEYKSVEYLFTFPDSNNFTHEDFAEVAMAMKFRECRNNWQRLRAEGEIVSAGFVNPQGQCYGRSDSLDLDYREQDTALLASQYR